MKSIAIITALALTLTLSAGAAFARGQSYGMQGTASTSGHMMGGMGHMGGGHMMGGHMMNGNHMMKGNTAGYGACPGLALNTVNVPVADATKAPAKR
ncbi:hypothetical protein [Desulfocurvibacter africanus]|uniref:hypothetical protein n=1 Tax=Desulfocurvibacter africanus TaxID=873 RepID=UPI0003FCC4B7|nr:hypothetical protein [Desulfocurvibacter africanus]